MNTSVLNPPLTDVSPNHTDMEATSGINQESDQKPAKKPPFPAQVATVLLERLLLSLKKVPNSSLKRAGSKCLSIVSSFYHPRMVYPFDQGHPGSFTAEIRGGKGFGLSVLCQLGLPVPPGATICAQAARYYAQKQTLPHHLAWELAQSIIKLEKESGLVFGSTTSPLLVSVRSGAAVSMAGMMDTILNVGINRQVLPALAARVSERFAWDSYRRFLSMFATSVLGIDRGKFESQLAVVRNSAGVKEDNQLTTEQLVALCRDFEVIIEKSQSAGIPDDPYEQLAMAIVAVMESWNNPRAIAYREEEGISPLLGTAVNIQAMIFGNTGENSGTGVVFSCNPLTGQAELYGEYITNAQGEDLVGGIRTPAPVKSLQEQQPEVYEQLVQHVKTLQRHFRDMVEVEFTVENGQLYILQVRTAKRAPEAALAFAVKQVTEGFWIEEDALASTLSLIDGGLAFPAVFKPVAKATAMRSEYLQGLPASPGAVCGRLYFDLDTAIAMAERGEKVILAREDTNPDDLSAMLKACGIVTSCGGATSHAAVVARGRHIPAVVGCNFSIINNKIVFPGGNTIMSAGDTVSLDGEQGLLMQGEVATETSQPSENLAIVRQWLESTQLRLTDTFIDTQLLEEKWPLNRWHNDFYLLNAMALASGKASNTLQSQLMSSLKEVEFQLSQILLCYLTYAIYTELAIMNGGARITNSAGQRLVSYGEFKAIKDGDYAQAVESLAQRPWSYQVEFFDLCSQAFLDSSWSSCCGGNAWSQIAIAPRDFLAGKVSNSIFIDHVFDLKHNGGVLFNKHKMVRVNENLLRNQLDFKKKHGHPTKLFHGMTNLNTEFSPKVISIFKAGAQEGLWQLNLSLSPNRLEEEEKEVDKLLEETECGGNTAPTGL